ncbi:DUF3556 domain-containing protein [Nocardia sp. NPDC003482]
MGFLSPRLPDLDYESWRRGTRMQRLRPIVLDWASAGVGSPDAVLLGYVVKIVLYVAVAIGIGWATPGLGSPTRFFDWWDEPLFFQKLVVWTLLFEVLGLGCGFGPLTLRFLPPIGGPLYWLRPGTIRLPPWPERVPGTRGSTRTPLDVALYVGVLAAAVFALTSPATEPTAHGDAPALAPARLLPILVLLALIGLRDKAIFLAARTEVYGSFLVMLMLPGADGLVGAKLVMLAIWWGAAVSKFNHHFPYVVAVMMSNNPILRSTTLKRKLFRDYPNDLRPSKVSAFLAHGTGTAFEIVMPAVIYLAHGGKLAIAAAILFTVFHLNILTSLPIGVPLEWNVFMIMGTWILFVDHGSLRLGDLTGPWALLFIAALVALVAYGNFVPKHTSFLMSMRYYAGNWPTSLWLFAPSALQKWDSGLVKSAQFPTQQLTRLYDETAAEYFDHRQYAFRSMHTHGRALYGLIPRAGGTDHERYRVVEGEIVAGSAIGWNFGDGHLHNEQLVTAVQRRCRFEPGELRVIVLESQPMHRQRQEYRLIDAATGTFEIGYVEVPDMLTGQPWDGTIPVHVHTAAEGAA